MKHVMRSLLAFAFVAASSAASAGYFAQTPPCNTTSEGNLERCRLDFIGDDVLWFTPIGNNFVSGPNETFFRAAEKGSGGGFRFGLPPGSTLDSRRLPTFEFIFRLRSVPVLNGAPSQAVNATTRALVRLVLTDERGRHRLVLNQEVFTGHPDDWALFSLRAKAQVYASNSVLTVEVVRQDATPGVDLGFELHEVNHFPN